MVNSGCVGCLNNSSRSGDNFFFTIPKVVPSRGDLPKELTEVRRNPWLANLNRSDLCFTNLEQYMISSDHFITVLCLILSFSSYNTLNTK